MTTPFTIRCAVATDLDALVELEQRSFASDQLSRRQLSRHLNSDSAALLVATQDSLLLGYALVFFRHRSAAARLYSLVVSGQARGRGLGRELLAAAEHAALQRGCRKMCLEVRSDNQQAIKLYELAGYQLRDLRPGYYGDGADARRYQKQLAETVLIGVGKGQRPPRPPNRACGFPAHGSPVGSFHIGGVSPLAA